MAELTRCDSENYCSMQWRHERPAHLDEIRLEDPETSHRELPYCHHVATSGFDQILNQRYSIDLKSRWRSNSRLENLGTVLDRKKKQLAPRHSSQTRQGFMCPFSQAEIQEEQI